MMFVVDLLIPVERAMCLVYNADMVTLHVRVSNNAARRLYSDTLGFETTGIEEKYYADGENAYGMCKKLEKSVLGL